MVIYWSVCGRDDVHNGIGWEAVQKARNNSGDRRGYKRERYTEKRIIVFLLTSFTFYFCNVLFLLSYLSIGGALPEQRRPLISVILDSILLWPSEQVLAKGLKERGLTIDRINYIVDKKSE